MYANGRAKQCLSRLWTCLWEKETKKNISSYIYGLFIEWWKFYKPINMVLFLWNTRDCVASVEMDWKPTYKFITNISRFCRVLIFYFCIFVWNEGIRIYSYAMEVGRKCWCYIRHGTNTADMVYHWLEYTPELTWPKLFLNQTIAKFFLKKLKIMSKPVNFPHKIWWNRI